MTEPRKHRSVSQINQYERCPMNYRLSRIDGVWKRPAAWLAQGSAVHEAAEQWEKSDRTMTVEEAQDVFRESYAKHIDEACETTPNFQFWFSSGPYKADNPEDPERGDIMRRYNIGLNQVVMLIDWHLANADQEIWVTPDGTRAIELPFNIELDGILVRGYIDAVRVVDGELRVVDYKTGNSPGDDFQLGVYSVAIAEMYGVDPPQLGEYFMGKTGKPTFPYKIGDWTRERVSAKFRELDANLAADNFEPKPERSKCQMCDVALACIYRAD